MGYEQLKKLRLSTDLMTDFSVTNEFEYKTSNKIAELKIDNDVIPLYAPDYSGYFDLNGLSQTVSCNYVMKNKITRNLGSSHLLIPD